MTDLSRPQRAALEAVARRFSATWESNPPRAWLRLAHQRVAVEIATLNRNRAPHNRAKPRLRFDKAVIRLMERLKAALRETVPDGFTVLLTVTAPIRLPAKTAAALEEKIQYLLTRPSPDRDQKHTIHGNRVRIRTVKHESSQAPKILGFVHNSDTDPLLLFNMARELLDLPSGRAAKLPSDRWLVLISAAESSCLDAYRYIYSQLRPVTNFKKVVMVFSDGRIAALADTP